MAISGKTNRPAWILFTVCLLVYTMTTYGGIRSTDSEIVFRTAESLASRGTFAVDEGVLWEGFGLAAGRDGRLYSVFGPTQSILMVPFVLAARALESTGWYSHFPLGLHPSHQVGQGLFYYVGSVTPVDLAPHALRAAVSLFNILVSSLTVLLFWFLLRSLGHTSRAATLTSTVLAFGSLLWAYSGTFFSEPLATLMILLSFFCLVRTQDAAHGSPASARLSFTGGFLLGIGGTVHITAFLFGPFFLLLTGAADGWRRLDFGRLRRAGGLFVLGLAVPLLMLLYYNHYRFGNILETGRTVDAALARRLFYGGYTLPFLGLYGLLFGGAKGLFVTSPSTALGVLSWGRFTRRYGYLAWVVLAALLFRLLFIASRTDWHGGYCLGPRYLMMAIPFLLIPLASWLDDPGNFTPSRITMTVVLTALISIQFHLVLGEIFTFYYLIKWTYAPHGIGALAVPTPYLKWKFTPLISMPPGFRAPWLLEWVPLSNRLLWLLVTVVLLPVTALLLRRKEREGS